jgi:hypothetical protein
LANLKSFGATNVSCNLLPIFSLASIKSCVQDAKMTFAKYLVLKPSQTIFHLTKSHLSKKDTEYQE